MLGAKTTSESVILDLYAQISREETCCHVPFFEKLRKERNPLFNNVLKKCYLWLYGIGLMVKDHSDSERGILLLPLHRPLFLIGNWETLFTCPYTFRFWKYAMLPHL